MTAAKHLPIYRDAYRLVAHLHQVTRKAPRDLRHTLVQRLLDETVECCVDIADANRASGPDRLARIDRLAGRIARVRGRSITRSGPSPGPPQSHGTTNPKETLMIHALVQGGQVTMVGLPSSGRLADGRTVSGYDALDADTLAAEGWVQVVDDVPAYDPDTQQVALDFYEPAGDHVTAHYTVGPLAPPQPPPVERIESLEASDVDMRAALDQLVLDALMARMMS